MITAHQRIAELEFSSENTFGECARFDLNDTVRKRAMEMSSVSETAAHVGALSPHQVIQRDQEHRQRVAFEELMTFN